MTNKVSTAFYCHRKLGHVEYERVSQPREILNGIFLIKRAGLKDHQCETCIQSASKKAAVRHSIPRSNKILELTETDISGKIR